MQLLIRINVYDEVTDLKFVGSPNTQKSKYTDNESLLFFQIKNSLIQNYLSSQYTPACRLHTGIRGQEGTCKYTSVVLICNIIFQLGPSVASNQSDYRPKYCLMMP